MKEIGNYYLKKETMLMFQDEAGFERILGLKNEVFASLEKVIQRLCESINTLTKETVKNITNRTWISELFE